MAEPSAAVWKAAKAGAGHYRDALDPGVYAYTGDENAEQTADKGEKAGADKDGAAV